MLFAEELAFGWRSAFSAAIAFLCFEGFSPRGTYSEFFSKLLSLKSEVRRPVPKSPC
jgi:hypothetical protein